MKMTFSEPTRCTYDCKYNRMTVRFNDNDDNKSDSIFRITFGESGYGEFKTLSNGSNEWSAPIIGGDPCKPINQIIIDCDAKEALITNTESSSIGSNVLDNRATFGKEYSTRHSNIWIYNSNNQFSYVLDIVACEESPITYEWISKGISELTGFFTVELVNLINPTSFRFNDDGTITIRIQSVM